MEPSTDFWWVCVFLLWTMTLFVSKLWRICFADANITDSNDGRFQERLIGNIVQVRNVLPKQRLEENKHDFHQHLNHSYNVVDCMDSFGFLGSSMEQNNAVGRKIFDVSLSNQLITGGTSLYAQHENSLLHQAKPHNGAVQSNYESFDNVTNAMIKQEQNETMLMGRGFGFNAYSLAM